MVECGRTVFAAPSIEVQAEREYLIRNYPGIKFYNSRYPLWTKPVGIDFQNPGSSKIPGRAKGLIEGGIYSRLLKERYTKRNLRRGRASVSKPPETKMTMEGCIVTLFILCGGMLFVACLVFSVESCNIVNCLCNSLRRVQEASGYCYGIIVGVSCKCRCTQEPKVKKIRVNSIQVQDSSGALI